MALKSDRSVLDTDISFFMNEAATRGGIASLALADLVQLWTKVKLWLLTLLYHPVKFLLVFCSTIWLTSTLLVSTSTSIKMKSKKVVKLLSS